MKSEKKIYNKLIKEIDKLTKQDWSADWIDGYIACLWDMKIFLKEVGIKVDHPDELKNKRNWKQP